MKFSRIAPFVLRGGVGIVSATLLLAATACSSGDAEGAEGQSVTLTLATTQTKDAIENDGLWRFVEILEEEAPHITIRYVGGPEAIDPDNAAEDVQSGALDMASVSSPYYSHLVPESVTLDLSPNDPAMDREGEAWAIWEEVHGDAGFHLLGLTIDEIAQFIHLGPKYASVDLEDINLDGFLIRAGSVQAPMVVHLGGDVINMPVSDIYTAMERGTIDGFTAGQGIIPLGLAEPVSATIMAPYLGAQYPLLFNQSRWESLDDETREALTYAITRVEEELPEIYGAIVEEQYEDWTNSYGIELLTLSEDAITEFQRTALQVTWPAVVPSSEAADKLQGILVPKG